MALPPAGQKKHKGLFSFLVPPFFSGGVVRPRYIL
jgi:hypothetical protein